MPRPNQYDYFGNVSTAATRLRAPRGLPADVRDIFEAIVSAAQADHFAPAERPLLVEYCHCLARSHRAEAAVRAEGEVVNGKPSPWLLILKDNRNTIGNLATKLRLAPNARTESKQVKAGEAPVTVDFSRLHRKHA